MSEAIDEIDDLATASGRPASIILTRIKRAIETGVYADGEQLPAERQLAITFGTARSTIRKILDQLEQRNLIVRRVGSGTFVNFRGPIRHDMEDIADLVSPLQLVETRFAVEPYMTRLAALHATGNDLDKLEDVLR
ncbi:MAG: FadR/GntR family transcriptional regulator, partial [Aestuariivirga sp.]